MDPQRVEFIHRHEDKSSLMKARVRNGQPWFLHDTLAVKENVQVDRARAGPVVIIPSERPFNFLEGGEKAAWRDVRFELHHAIQEPSVAGIGPVPNRFSFIQERDAFKP